MRRCLAECALIVAGAMLLGSQPACAQEPHPQEQLKPAAHEQGPRIIHPDLHPPEGHEDEEHGHTQLWARADWWLAWIKDPRFPPLVTVGPTTQPSPGALNAEGTMIRFGGRLDAHERQGASFHVGGWLDCEQCVGIEAGFLFLGSRNIFFEASSWPSPAALARPFFNVNTGLQDSSLITYPEIVNGRVAVTSGTTIYGADASALYRVNCSEDYPLRFLVGLRYLHLYEDLSVQEDVVVQPSSPVFTNQTIAVHDHFECANYFYGINLGFSAGYNVRRLELTAAARCGLGLSQEVVRVGGFTNFDGPGGTTIPSGFLAVSSNIGNRVRETFAVVPEVDLTARFELTRHCYVSAGWNFLYWSNVARVGQQVDININPNLVPTSSTFGMPVVNQSPRLSVTDSEFYMHGVHFGVELRF